MSEQTVKIRLADGGAEDVALKLLAAVAAVEKKNVPSIHTDWDDPLADRKWILDTYAECLRAVTHRRLKTG